MINIKGFIQRGWDFSESWSGKDESVFAVD